MSLEKIPSPVLWVAAGLLTAILLAGVLYVAYDVWSRYLR